MSNVNEQRVFEIDFGCLLEPDDFLSYYANGMLVPTDREKFLKGLSEYEQKEAIEILVNREKRATEEIAKILKAESEWIPETEEEQKTRSVKEKKNATEKYLSEVADLKEALHNRMNN
jgi:uncharacterized protein YwgA